MNTPTLAIIIPCYNEAEALPETHRIIGELLSRLKNNHQVTDQSFVCYVDDGSCDHTWQLIQDYADKEVFKVYGLRLSRNFGHQHALLAGMMSARKYVDCTITIDADLQQDLDAIDEFLVHYHQGKDIIYGVRNDRETDGWFKQMSARGFYRLMSLMGVNLLANHADYRLLSSRAMDALSTYGEHHLFLRALVKDLGFEEAVVYFDVHERTAGSSKYSLKKMVMLALDGITSFSVVPLRMIAVLGLLFTLFAMLMTGYVLVQQYLLNNTVPGWSTIVLSIYLVGGLQLLAMGIIGEYLGKIYIESKHRPQYLIEDTIVNFAPAQHPSTKTTQCVQ